MKFSDNLLILVFNNSQSLAMLNQKRRLGGVVETVSKASAEDCRKRQCFFLILLNHFTQAGIAYFNEKVNTETKLPKAY